MDVQDTTGTSKALIPAAKVDAPNPILSQHGGAHDAWLDGDIEVDLVEDLDWMLREDTSNSNKLGVPGAVQGSIRLVHAATNDLAVFDEDAADWRLVALECKLGLIGR